MKQISKYKILILALNLMLFACTKEVNFNQINDLQITPAIESSLIFFDEPANRFLDNGNEVLITQDFIIIDFFENEFIVDNLVKTDLVFETENSINRRFDLQVDFFDKSQQLQHSFTLKQEASTNNNEITSKFIEVFEDGTLDALKNTSVIVFTLRLFPGNPPINQTTPGRIKLKSKVVFYFNIIDPI
tara:strand:+ start:836 stop:1399 length:564 start_codon:yes stop_codon:yes gene_type:complete